MGMRTKFRRRTEPTPTTDPTPDAQPEAPVLGWDGKAFDPERAHRTLLAAQQAEKDAKAALAEYKKAQDRAKLDEVERAKAEAADWKAKAEAAENAAKAEKRGKDIARAAAKLGFNDPEDAERFVNADESDVETALTALLAAKPYLGKGASGSKQAADAQAASVTTSPANGAKTAQKLTLDGIKKMTPAEYAANREAILEFGKTYKRA